MVKIQIDSLWGKLSPYKSLIQHMKDVSIVMDALLQDSIYLCDIPLFCTATGLSQDQIRRLLCYLAAIHDIGKADPRFQCEADAAKKANLPIVSSWGAVAHEFRYQYVPGTTYRHEYGSELYLSDFLETKTTREVAEVLSAIVGLHHQGKGGSIGLFRCEPWQRARDEINDVFFDMWRPVMPAEIKKVDAFGYLVTALIILADWIASSDLLVNSEAMTDNQIYSVVYQFISDAGLRSSPLPTLSSFTATWAHANIKHPSPMQSALSSYVDTHPNDEPFMVLIEAEPGSGKSEAAIYAAVKMAESYGKSGMYIGLPTMATANNMVSRVRNFQNAHGMTTARLLHGMAWMQGKEQLQTQAARWFSPTRLALLQSSGVGTVDQSMSAVLPIKYGSLRLLGLSSKVLIIDEVHSYDDYMLAIIRRLLEFCKSMRIPVIMLSATLPTIKKEDLLKPVLGKNSAAYKPATGYPLITMVGTDGVILDQIVTEASFHRSYAVQYVEEWDLPQIAHHLIDKVANGGCAAYFCNTVKEAQQLYLCTKEFLPADGELILFHARFSAGRRDEIENQCLRLFGKEKEFRPKKAILICTQIAEQSLDLDFDYIMSDLAPIDMLLQRMGRCFRHDATSRPGALASPSVMVVSSESQKYANTRIYDEEYLKRTEEVLSGKNILTVPDDIRPAIETVYGTYSNTGDGSGDGLEAAVQAAAREAAGNAILGRMLEKPKSRVEMKTFTHLDCLLDENDDPACTRQGTDTTRIAIVPPSLYRKMAEELTKSGQVFRDTVQEVMKYSVSTYSYKVDKLPDELKECFEPGEGLLFGLHIAKGDKEVNPTGDLVLTEGTAELKVSRELGLEL